MRLQKQISLLYQILLSVRSVADRLVDPEVIHFDGLSASGRFLVAVSPRSWLASATRHFGIGSALYIPQLDSGLLPR